MARVHVAAVLAILVGATCSPAHDLWLVPPSKPTLAKPVVIQAHVGMDFPLGEVAPDPANFQRRWLVNPDGSEGELVAVGKEGKAGLLSFTPKVPGLYVVAVETKPKLISLSADQFNHYLVSDGLPHIFRLRYEEKTLDQSARERYSKYVKAYVQVGADENGNPSRALGQILELVPLKNPLTASESTVLPVQVHFRGKPLAEANLGWQHPGDGPAARGYVRTDGDGKALVPIGRRGLMTLRVTHMTRPKNQDYEWESFWTTLTFRLGE